MEKATAWLSLQRWAHLGTVGRIYIWTGVPEEREFYSAKDYFCLVPRVGRIVQSNFGQRLRTTGITGLKIDVLSSPTRGERSRSRALINVGILPVGKFVGRNFRMEEFFERFWELFMWLGCGCYGQSRCFSFDFRFIWKKQELIESPVFFCFRKYYYAVTEFIMYIYACFLLFNPM